jgi:DNA-binding NarL/FixJ family response regulator
MRIRSIDYPLIKMKKTESIDFLPLKQIRILLAEDHANVRKFLKLSVELDGDIEVVGEAKNGREAVRLTKSLCPEVVVMDIAMPMLNGIQATRQITETSPAAKVLILSAYPDPEYIKQAVLSGASGYLIKQSSTQALAQAVREVLKGNTYFSASISTRLRNQCLKLFCEGRLLKKQTAHPAFSDGMPNRRVTQN